MLFHSTSPSQQNGQPVLTVSNFRDEELCFLGGPGDGYWLCNRAGHTRIPKANKHEHDKGGKLLSPFEPET